MRGITGCQHRFNHEKHSRDGTEKYFKTVIRAVSYAFYHQLEMARGKV